jgi:hypothetical protein
MEISTPSVFDWEENAGVGKGH